MRSAERTASSEGTAPALRGASSAATSDGVPAFARRLAAYPRAHWLLSGLALLLASPALWSGFQIDDYVMQLIARGETGIPGLHGHPWLLFTFANGRPADNHAMMDTAALLPWWSDPNLLNAFFRPLSALTHRLDFALWPEQAWLQHLHSLAWFAALLLVVAHVYRRFEQPPRVALLAFALFALDGSHGMTVSWIANRNALVSATLALSALSAHHRWLSQRWRPGRWLGPLCFTLGLCAGETAVAVFGYLLAYAIALDQAPIVRRVQHLAPYFVPLALLGVMFKLYGLGSIGSGGYHDPAREPVAYALSLVHHLPVLLSAELGLPLADVWFWGPPWMDVPIWALSVFTVVLLAAVGHVLLSHDREARFWLIGMIISGCAVSASVPGERLLLVPSLGAAVFLAKLIHALWPLAYARKPLPWLLLFVLCLIHFGGRPLMFPVRAQAMGEIRDVIERADAGIPKTPEIRDQTVVVVNAPFDMLVSYLQVEREAQRVPRPRHLYWLAAASSELTLQTRDASTLRMRPARGFLLTPPERHYRGDPTTLVAGTRVALSEMTVEVLEQTPDHRPAVADFHFAAPLDSPRYRFLQWAGGRLVPFTPPLPGGSVQFESAGFFSSLSKQAFGHAPAP
jgi:hypothetical protein